MDNSLSLLTELVTFIVRLLGLVLVVIGLYVGVKVIIEAWDLYEHPERIERFAGAIENGSQIDALLESLARPQSNSTQISDNNQTDLDTNIKPAEQVRPKINMAYFLAWAIVILLLMIIGGLASSAMRTGGQLALYDLQVKRFARQLIKEVRKDQA